MKNSINKFEVNGQDIIIDDPKISKIENNISNINNNIGAKQFNPETIYNVGDVVYYNEKLYHFIKEHNGVWSVDDVESWDYNKEIDKEKGIFTYSYKYNPYIKELYITGEYNGIQAKDLKLRINRCGCNTIAGVDNTSFLYIYSDVLNDYVFSI